MATKKLSRSVVEPGQRAGRTHDRRMWNRSDRRAAKHYYSVRNTEWEDGYREPQESRNIWWEFADTLKPVYRWLDSKLGTSWDDAWSELCRDADIRTVKGWHLRDHVKGIVTGAGGREFTIGGLRRGWGYFVDDEGILRYEEYKRSHNPGIYAAARRLSDKFGTLLMMRVGDKLFWFEPIRRERLVGLNPYETRSLVTGYRQICEISQEWYDHLETYHPKAVEKMLDWCKSTFDSTVNLRVKYKGWYRGSTRY